MRIGLLNPGPGCSGRVRIWSTNCRLFGPAGGSTAACARYHDLGSEFSLDVIPQSHDESTPSPCQFGFINSIIYTHTYRHRSFTPVYDDHECRAGRHRLGATSHWRYHRLGLQLQFFFPFPMRNSFFSIQFNAGEESSNVVAQAANNALCGRERRFIAG